MFKVKQVNPSIPYFPRKAKRTEQIVEYAYSRIRTRDVEALPRVGL